jgi:hypothetical protein
MPMRFKKTGEKRKLFGRMRVIYSGVVPPRETEEEKLYIKLKGKYVALQEMEGAGFKTALKNIGKKIKCIGSLCKIESADVSAPKVIEKPPLQPALPSSSSIRNAKTIENRKKLQKFIEDIMYKQKIKPTIIKILAKKGYNELNIEKTILDKTADKFINLIKKSIKPEAKNQSVNDRLTSIITLLEFKKIKPTEIQTNLINKYEALILNYYEASKKEMETEMIKEIEKETHSKEIKTPSPTSSEKSLEALANSSRASASSQVSSLASSVKTEASQASRTSASSSASSIQTEASRTSSASRASTGSSGSNEKIDRPQFMVAGAKASKRRFKKRV